MSTATSPCTGWAMGHSVSLGSGQHLGPVSSPDDRTWSESSMKIPEPSAGSGSIPHGAEASDREPRLSSRFLGPGGATLALQRAGFGIGQGKKRCRWPRSPWRSHQSPPAPLLTALRPFQRLGVHHHVGQGHLGLRRGLWGGQKEQSAKGNQILQQHPLGAPPRAGAGPRHGRKHPPWPQLQHGERGTHKLQESGLDLFTPAHTFCSSVYWMQLAG